MRARGWGVLLLLPLLCGCSMQEVDERTPVTAAAWDRKTLVAQTVTVSSADAVPETELTELPADSVRQGIDRSGQSTFWTTAETFLLDQTVVQTGLEPLVRELSAEPSIRPSVRLCVVRNTDGTSVLKAEPDADGLSRLLDDAVRDGRAVDMPLYQSLDDLLTDGVDLALPALTVEQDTVQTKGTAVFHGGTLCGWLDEEQTETLSLLRGDTNRIELYQGDERFVLTQICADCTVTADDGGSPQAELTIQAKLADSSDRKAQQAAQLLRQSCLDTVQQLQRQGSDALGLGRELYRSAPERFDAQRWEQQYLTLPVTVQVIVGQTQGGEVR